jgi:predicted nucleic acid-binding protein
MQNSVAVCIDANLVVKRVAEPRHLAIRQWWEQWAAERPELIAPTLLPYEVTNALHREGRAGTLSPQAVDRALRAALALPISLHGDRTLHREALEIARLTGIPATYDAHYLALAERLDLLLWTADERLFNAVGHRFPRVRLVK